MLGPILLLIFLLQFKIIQRTSILFISDKYAAQSNPQYMYTLATQFVFKKIVLSLCLWCFQFDSLNNSLCTLLLSNLIKASVVLGLLLFYLTFLEFVPCSKDLLWV
jgi:hypothetical protein